MKRRKDAICILLRASTFVLRRLLDLISEDSLSIRIPSCLRRRAFDTDGIREHLARNRRSFFAHSPVGVVVFESTEYAAMDRMERIREGVRRRYLAASSRARLIHERDDCNGEISSPKLDSKFKRLVAVLVAVFDFHRGALARAFGYSSVLDLGPFYFKLRVDALFSCSQALNRADFEAEQQNPANFESPTSNAIPDLQINPANFASTPLKL